MTWALLAAFLAGGAALAARPFVSPRPWPREMPDERDDVARTVSSLRDLEFARAAGTISPEDHARLRTQLERGAFAPAPAEAGGPAPVRTFVVAALLAGIAATLVVAYLPGAAGDRAPGTTITGTVPDLAPGIAELEERVAADPEDVPTRLALGDAYFREGRMLEAARAYQAVLERDRESVPALNGLALVLYRSGEREGAMIAVDRVLELRPRDPDALFLKGLALYQAGDLTGAVEVWDVYLEVGEFHPAAGMVRPLYEDARERAGR